MALLVFLAGCISSAATFAAQGWRVYGQGDGTCGQWTSEHYFNGNLGAKTQNAWALGFVSGAGFAGAKISETDPDAIRQYISNYCRQKPLEHISDAAGRLVIDLMKRK